MTDKLTLANIATVQSTDAVGNIVSWREFTESDLVEVIESLGGEVVRETEVSWCATHGYALEVPSPGRYVILPIPEGGEG